MAGPIGAPGSYPLVPKIEQAILLAIRTEIEKQAEAEMERVVASLRSKIQEIVAKVVLGLATQVSFSPVSAGRELSIRVVLPENKA